MQQLLKKWRQFSRRLPGTRGQSLVETALVLPIIVALLAGLVEISNLLITQNRVNTAARVGTSFGASNFSSNELDASTTWAEQVSFVATNNVTETLDLDPARWDIYVVRATVEVSATAPSGYDFSNWVDLHGYGDFLVMSQSTWDSRQDAIQADVLAALQATSETTLDPDGVEILATFAYHDRSSILRIPFFDLGEYTRVRGFNVSRLDAEAPFSGCLLTPIAVRFDGFSVYPSNWDPATPLHPEYASQDPVNIFPVGNGGSGFEEPDPAPTYIVGDGSPTNVFADPNNFEQNLPGIPLENARPGYLYLAREGTGSGGFGWLDWNTPPSSQGDLVTSLTYPGDFVYMYPGSNADLDQLTYDDDDGNHIVTGNSDGQLAVGEWIHSSTGNINSAGDITAGSFDRPLTFVVYDETEGSGSGKIYRVKGYMVAKIVGFSFQAAQKWVMVEFIRWNTDCERLD